MFDYNVSLTEIWFRAYMALIQKVRLNVKVGLQANPRCVEVP